MFESVTSWEVFVVLALYVIVYFAYRIEQHLSVIRSSLDSHQVNVEESLKEISYSTEQTVSALQDLNS